MELKKDYILVKELTDDMMIDGLLEKYDDNSPFIHATIVEANKDFLTKINETYSSQSNAVLLFSRPNKIPYLGYLIVHEADLISTMSKEEYERRIRGGK